MIAEVGEREGGEGTEQEREREKERERERGAPCSEKLLRRNVKRFRGGLVFRAHRRVYHSTLGLRVIKKRRRVDHARAQKVVHRF